MSVIKLLGIDPSLRNTGLALGEFNIVTGDLQIKALRLVVTKPKGKAGKEVRQSSHDRADGRILYQGLQSTAKEWGVAMAIAELPTGAQDARAAFSNGMSTMLCATTPVPIIEVSPSEVKVATGASRKASKDEMIQWAVSRWPHAGWLTRKFKGEVELLAANEHLADACAAIAAGILTGQFAQAVALMNGMQQAA